MKNLYFFIVVIIIYSGISRATTLNDGSIPEEQQVMAQPQGVLNPIIGTWKFTSYRYQGQELPIPNPDLDLRFTFDEKGYSLLKWFRTNETGHCQRLAEYSIQAGNILYQKSIWVDPENHFSCSSDVEMRPGAETFTNIEFENEKLLLILELSGERFVYVMTRIAPPAVSEE